MKTWCAGPVPRGHSLTPLHPQTCASLTAGECSKSREGDPWVAGAPDRGQLVTRCLRD